MGENVTPHFKVEKRPPDPVSVSSYVESGGAFAEANRRGLAQLVAISPAPDLSEFALALPHKNVHIFELLKAPEEKALVLVMYAEGEGEDAADSLDSAAKNIDLLLNSWENPEEFIKFMYSKRETDFSV